MGKTPVYSVPGLIDQKHPHVHGEDKIYSVAISFGVETPPRAWGRPDDIGLGGIAFRNTPTCMGKTLLYSRHPANHKKHPHVHGEDPPAYKCGVFPVETPPRAWGRRF